MPTLNTVPHLRTKTVSEVRNGSVSFVGKLDAGELLTGNPTVTVSPSGPTIGNQVVNTAQLTIDHQIVAVGQAVQFSVSGGTAGVSYVITVQCGTTANPPQTLEAFCNLKVVSD